MLGDLIYDAKGKIAGVRVLAGGVIEQSFQARGKQWGIEGNEVGTAVSTWRPDGTFSFEVNSVFVSDGGDAATFKGQGIGWPTGKGQKASIRGSAHGWTQSQKLAALNKVVTVFEVEVDEDGNYTNKGWAWK